MSESPSAMSRTLERIIEKPLGSYRPEAELRLALKRRLTKKEYKVLMARVEGTPSKEELMAKLRLERNRYEEIWHTIGKKLNLDSRPVAILLHHQETNTTNDKYLTGSA